MVWKIPLFKIYWDQDDVKAVTDAITAGKYWAEGPSIKQFEEALSDYFGSKYSLVFNSGTSAMHAVLNAYGFNQNHEVIVPSFTFIATSNSPLFVGSKPTFADIEEQTYGLNPQSVHEQITRKTKAILPVHYGGCPCKIKELREIADEHDLLLIEDVAESFGATVDGKKAGCFGESSVLSFCQNKVITTGEGGAVVTNDKELYEKMKLFRSHGRLEEKDYFSSIEYMDYVSLGYNFRMSNITAALGLSQLKKADKIIKMRQENAAYLTAKLSEISQVKVMHAPEGLSHVYQLYTIRVDERHRDPLMQYLARKGIMTKVYFAPIHLTHFYKDVLKYKCKLPVTEQLSRQVLTLPMSPSITKPEMDLVADEIGKFFREQAK